MKRTTLTEFKLESKKVLTRDGVRVSVTVSPHRDGNPKHEFYEVWIKWIGVTIRSSSILHDEATRVMVSDFLEDATGIDHYATLSEKLNEFDWHHNG